MSRDQMMGMTGSLGGMQQPQMRPGGNAEAGMRRQQFMQAGGRVPGNSPQWGSMGGMRPPGVHPTGAPQRGGGNLAGLAGGGRLSIGPNGQLQTMAEQMGPGWQDPRGGLLGGASVPAPSDPSFSAQRNAMQGMFGGMSGGKPGMGQPMPMQPGGGLQSTPQGFGTYGAGDGGPPPTNDLIAAIQQRQNGTQRLQRPGGMGQPMPPQPGGLQSTPQPAPNQWNTTGIDRARMLLGGNRPGG